MKRSNELSPDDLDEVVGGCRPSPMGLGGSTSSHQTHTAMFTAPTQALELAAPASTAPHGPMGLGGSSAAASLHAAPHHDIDEQDIELSRSADAPIGLGGDQ